MIGLRRFDTRWEWPVVSGLLALHLVVAFTATIDASATFDEVLHITSGLSYWRFGDYRFQPENGNLPQRWCALPILSMACPFPDDQDAWLAGDSFRLGVRLLYASEMDPQAILAAARAMSGIWSVALCLTVFLWSKSLFGLGGGFVSLWLATFWPALIAHGPLATSDVCGGFFFTLGSWSLWRLLNDVSGTTLAATAAAVGLAAIAKHTCVLLLPLALIFCFVVLASKRLLPIQLGLWSATATSLPARLSLALASLTLPLAAAVGCIWASCGFRYRAAAPEAVHGEFFRYATLAECVGYAGGVGLLCDQLAAWRALPESWLWGMSQVVARSSHRYAFAIGEHSVYGWWWFFPLCLAVKNTLPSLALCGWGVVRQVARIATRLRAHLPLRRALSGSVPLLIVLAVLWPIFLTSHLNIGERHLLPSYPPLMILAGGCWRAARSRWSRLLLCGLLGLHAADVLSRYPFTLAYFNQAVPRGSEYQWLVDSNLDWGQDLGRLKSWLDHHAHADEPIYVTFSGAEPVQRRIPLAENLGFPRGWGSRQVLLPGLYCVSASALQTVADRPRGPWCRAFETAYADLLAWMQASADQSDPVAAVRLLRGIVRDRDEYGLSMLSTPPTPDDLAVAAFNILQAGRLKAFLRHRAPDASIGGSILVHRLRAADIEQALHGPPAELAAQSWFERERYGTADELIRKGRRHLDNDEPHEALAVFQSSTRLYSGDLRAWDGLAVAYRVLGDEKRAAHAERRRNRLQARLNIVEPER